MIRVAAVADVHAGPEHAGRLRPQLAELPERADVLLVGGDLTRVGRPEEAEVLAGELDGIGVPVIAVLGNHDVHAEAEEEVCKVLDGAGVRILRGESEIVDTPGGRLGVAGVKGFGHGFPGRTASDFGEREVKAFVRHAKDEACRLEELLRELDGRVDARVALMHYAPVEATLAGEPEGIWAFLGSYFLAEAIDRAGADLAIHGHAHAGSETGCTPGGVPVRNVAQPVIKRPYTVFCLDRNTAPGC